MGGRQTYKIKNAYPQLRNPHKYTGRDKRITLRSGWEIAFVFKILDVNPVVLEWSSEDFHISYFDPAQNKNRRYFPDFYMKLRDEDNSIKEVIVEIKPFKETTTPKKQKRITESYQYRVKTFVTNTAKWDSARNFCKRLRLEKQRNITFEIFTEKELRNFGLKI